MTRLATVHALWRYPVKSMGGESVASADLDTRGVVGDRAWAVVTADGKVASGKTTRRFARVDGLLALAARGANDDVEVALPSGALMRIDDPGLPETLATVLGQRVSVARDAGAYHFDAAPIHVVSTASLDWLAAQVPGVAVDARRLRPNLVVDAGAAPLAEEAWMERTIAVGDAVLRVVDRTERCVMTTMAQGDLPASAQVLERIARANGACLGMYAEVVRPGRIRVGDEVILS